MDKTRSGQRLLFLTFAVFLIAAAYSSHFLYDYIRELRQKRVLFEKRKASWQQLQKNLKEEIGLFRGEAGIFIKDLETCRDISYNKDKPFASASLAKIPLMAACFRAAEEGRITLEREITLRSADKLTGSGTLKAMRPGAVFTVGKLIELMICDSDNTATNMLTDAIGIEYLNESFRSFGLKDTALSRKIADYGSRDKGIENFTTAGDMAILLEKLYRGRIVNKRVSEECVKLLKLCRAADRIPKYLPSEATAAHKTGLEREVCHDAGIVFTRKGDFIIVVLTRHTNKTSAPSKEFIAKTALHTYNYLNSL